MSTVIDFITNLFYLNGHPLRLPANSMRHLYPIYNRPDNSILLKFGRQTHKSTTIGNKLVYPCVKIHNYHTLYVAPTGKQVSVFSTDKLDSPIRESKIIQERYVDTQTKDQIFYKELANGSKIYLRSAYLQADSIRGISADQSNIDEVQDILSDHIPVIEQCMSHSYAKYELMKEYDPNLPIHLFHHKIYSGTPKTIENTMEKYWDKSTQNEWIIKCQHCARYNYINELNVGKECMVCNKCQKPIYYEDGNWVSMKPGESIQGYRLPQIVLNWVNNRNNPEVWKSMVIEPMNTYTTDKFFNDVLALPYAASKHPLTMEDLQAACKDFEMIAYPGHPMLKGVDLFFGIDWGKGDTATGTSYSILTIGGKINNLFTTIFMKKYTGRLSEATSQIEDMIKIINMFKCKFGLADTGDGRTSNAILVNRLTANRFAEIYEHGSVKKKIRWAKHEGIYVMNRNRMMTDRMMEIKRCQVNFFRWNEFKVFATDFLNIYTDYSERTRLTRYDHIGPDDSFHSYMFCRIANMIIEGELNKYLMSEEDDSDSDNEPRNL